MFKIAIASGKGGTGKTFIATNLFYTIANEGYDSILVDCDAEAPNDIGFFNANNVSAQEVTQLVPEIDEKKCTFCGECHDYCNYNAIFILPPVKIIKVIEELCHGCGACTVACKFDAITEKPVSLGRVSVYSHEGRHSIIEGRTNTGVMSSVPVVKAAIRQAGNQAHVVILDSPPGTSCPFIHTAAASDFVILVTEPTPFGLSDLKQSAETLDTMNKTYGVIINRAGLGNDDIYRWLNEKDIPVLMEVPFDREIARVYSEGKILAEENEQYRDMFSRLIEKIDTIFENQLLQQR